MKNPISWHRECARNVRRSLEDAERDLARSQERINRLREQADLYDRQIAEAERRGMTGFDSDRLLVRRHKLDASAMKVIRK